MALSFPLSLADFWDKLPVALAMIDPTENTDFSMTEGGEFLSSEKGVRLWRGSVTFGAMNRAEAALIEPLMSVARGAAASFFVTDKRFPEPQAQPATGVSPIIWTINANNREMALYGLVSGFTLRAGDYLSFQYGSPAKYAFHRIVTPVTVAGVSGGTAQFEVTPNIQPGWTLGTAVVLSKPFFKARYEPRTFDPGQRARQITSGTSFRIIQDLR